MSICPVTRQETPSIFIPEARADTGSALYLSRSHGLLRLVEGRTLPPQRFVEWLDLY